MTLSARYAIAFGLSCLALMGCSEAPNQAQIVTGRVVFKGKPVAGAGIQFYEPFNGFGLVANLDSDGRYATPSPLPPGNYQVSITANQGGTVEGPNAPIALPVTPDYVDEAYRDGSTSHLEAKVSRYQTEFDFDISEPPKTTETPTGVLVRIPPAKGHR